MACPSKICPAISPFDLGRSLEWAGEISFLTWAKRFRIIKRHNLKKISAYLNAAPPPPYRFWILIKLFFSMMDTFHLKNAKTMFWKGVFLWVKCAISLLKNKTRCLEPSLTLTIATKQRNREIDKLRRMNFAFRLDSFIHTVYTKANTGQANSEFWYS